MIMPITQTKIDKQYRQLDVVVCSEPEPISTTLSKCRVRIFYRGFNRNRTFISDDFAQQLINSLPYVPIKGIFNYGKVDYEDHGTDNTDGRIYGIIAANPNFAWEKHIDQDGIEREYACADAILFSALYPEAKIIVGSRQSMEIYPETMEGYWDTWEDGMPYFYFKKGELLGLQVLGQDVEPCFEGAAFYSLAKEVKELVEYVKSFKEQEEKKNMDIKEEVVATPETTVEEVATENTVTLQDEEPAVIEQVEEPVIMQTEESVVVQEDNPVVIAEEANSIESTIETTAQDFEKATEEVFEKKCDIPDEEEEKKKEEEDEKAKNSLLETVESLKSEIDSLKATQAEYRKKIDEFNSENVRLNNELMDIKNKNAELSEYKLSVETSKKEAVLSKFEEMLTEEQYNSFKEDISKYTESDLEKEIIATIYHTNPNAFAKKEPELIYKDSNKDVVTESGVLGLLNRYKNGGNK